MYTRFKNRTSILDRKKEANKVLTSYPDRVPVIFERDGTAPYHCPQIDRNKYLIPRNLTIGQFLIFIRDRMKFDPGQAIFLFVKGTMPPSGASISDIYQNYKDIDDFLYITYTFENTFG